MTLPAQLYRVEQVRAIDNYAITVIGIPGIELMNRAGIAAYQQMKARWPEANSISCFCAAGNNAGDGYVVAGLALADGMQVQLIAVRPPTELTGDALLAAQAYLQVGGAFCGVDQLSADVFQADILVDALFGTGLDRGIEGIYAELIQSINHAANSRSTACVALDIPSGLHADTGQVLNIAVQADLTVTFVALKQGLFTGAAADHCGEIVFDDLGIPLAATEQQQVAARLVIPDNPLLSKRAQTTHKGQCGHVLLIGGDRGYNGAIRLAAEASARCGAGLISIATHPEHAALLNLSRPELMVSGVNNSAELQACIEKATVLVVGPGLGQSAWARMLLDSALQTNLPTVIDADGLNLLALRSVAEKSEQQWVLTPHPGEAGRLLNISTADVQQDRFQALQQLTSQYSAVVLLKGAGTLIGDQQQMLVNQTGNPGMASGGMGDVLSGVIGALLAQGMPRLEATACGAWLHGAAADAAAVDGERGLLASDLMSHLRTLVNS